MMYPLTYKIILHVKIINYKILITKIYDFIKIRSWVEQLYK